ncbi:hypothetical protein ALC62_12257 [Cyphomyrmex costatus]|uniref:MADF domain-containing protein n=1 Tax=Cyphomyrmex costatus TaxID=456900 RepID=A0A151IBM1_9HYME|nr:hypothetical protein ALC62_12257 [Cyphomyrmex costatus]
MSTNINKDNDLKIDEKEGEDYLIDLYRERHFLYDKRDRNFKDNEMKANAWLEISKIMIEKNCGNYYTPEYCQKRLKTLREKFSRLQRNDKNTKSGSAASTEKPSPLLNQMSFLNTYIQRRRLISLSIVIIFLPTCIKIFKNM